MPANIAIIPVRTGSKRLPNKNTLDFFGKPMFMHTVEAAVKSQLFDEVHVSTESLDVLKICNQYKLSVKFLRDEALATDTATLTSLCEYILRKYRNEYDTCFDNFCLLWATAPLRKSIDITKSYQMLSGKTDAVVSVTNYDLPVFCSQYQNKDGYLQPNFPEMFWSKNEIPNIYCDNGALCWVKVEVFNLEKTWMPKKTKPYFMEKSRSVDIDTKEDLDLAKYYYAQSLKSE